MPDKKQKPGTENLIPINERTTEEQKKIATAGGIASGEARRRKKKFKTVLNDLLKIAATNPAHLENLKKLGIGTEDATLQTVMAAAMITQACNGNVKAFNAVRDTLGEVPKAKVELDGELQTQNETMRAAYEDAANAIKGIITPKA